MRVVLDTNVIISGFLWQGAPYDVLKSASKGLLTGFTSLPLLNELNKVLSGKKFVPILTETGFTPEKLIEIYESFTEIVVPAESDEVIIVADPTDDAVVLTAETAHASFVITGNSHLLKLRSYKGIPIVTPSDFLNLHLRRSR